MLVSSLGTAVALDLGIPGVYADENVERLSFGKMEPLVDLLQETPTDRLLPDLVERINHGTTLRELVSATALANARTFGGSHYEGFHAFMALAPAFHMASALPKERQPLPVLKVLYRNSMYIQGAGGSERERLHPVLPSQHSDRGATCRHMREAMRHHDVEGAERDLASLARTSSETALNDLLQFNVEHDPGVHEIVLVWRAWELLEFVGREHAHTLLRQSVRQNIADAKKPTTVSSDPPPTLVATLLERHRLGSSPLGRREADDAWIEQMISTLLCSTIEQASEAAATALAEGFLPEHVGEAVALAANQLVLRQVENWPGAFDHRTHGDSPGVHASDAVNAWRNVARVSSVRNQAASLILAAGYVAKSHRWSEDPRYRGHERRAFPTREHLAQIKTVEPAALLRDLDGAIRENDQLRACAIVQHYSDQGHPTRPVFDVLLRYAISEDGRLHAEKYYRTVVEEFAAIRPSFRWRQLVALARVIASSFGFTREDARGEGAGYRAPGYEEACRLLRA
jgi:hypothetical protein